MSTTESRDLAFSAPKIVIQTTHKGKKITYVVLDNEIVQRLGIDEESCKFSQAITDQGLVLKLIRKSDP